MSGEIEEQLAVQLRRIEAVHRGFLYQHLFGVACLFLASAAGVDSIAVEQDEDVELSYNNTRRYVQIKTRADVLTPSDLNTTLGRFRDLQRLHQEGTRNGVPEFWLVANVELSQSAKDSIVGSGVNITVHTPTANIQDTRMPPAWASLADAIAWCQQAAASVPFSRLAPDTLVWKLASEIAWACTGTRPQGHALKVAGLAELFEQFATALQRLPEPPEVYRTQIDEPQLESDKEIRLLVALSGGGKTAWAAVHALHATGELVYFDSSGVPSGVAPSALARECGARLLTRTGASAKDVFMPGATGFDSLRLLALEARRTATPVLLIFDNAQVVDVDVMRQMVSATAGCRWVVLARPWPGAAALEAHWGIARETLQGFALVDIADEFRIRGAPIDVTTAERVRRLTGGLPLFVRDAARLTAAGYAANAKDFCDAIESRTNPFQSGQDVIAHDVVSHVTAENRSVAGVIALSELPLTRDEATRLAAEGVQLSSAAATMALRELSAWGIVQASLTGEIAIHDAFRGELADVRAQIDAAIVERGYRTLGRLLIASFGPGQFDRLVQFCKIAPRIGQVQTLIDLSNAFSEQLQERGKAEELIWIVDDAAGDETLAPIERFWAADTVAFWRMWGTEAEVESDVVRLAGLLALVPSPPVAARMSLEMKWLVLAGRKGDRDSVRLHYAAAQRIADSSLQRRVVRYNFAVALNACGQHQGALLACAALVRDYFAHFQLTPRDLFMVNAGKLHDTLGDRAQEYDELKRFADALQLAAIAADALGRVGGLVRIWAHKLYILAWAPRSAVRVGMDFVDEMLGMMGDAEGARMFIERVLVPTVTDMQLLGYVVPVQAQYAVVLAYCGDYPGARRVINELPAFAADAMAESELESQGQLVEAIAAGQRRLRLLPPPPGSGPLPSEFAALPDLGRNERCFCESGLKFKQCCGRHDS